MLRPIVTLLFICPLSAGASPLLYEFPHASSAESLSARVAPPPGVPEVVISERGVRYAVDPAGGHKTGFFLDQRDNRKELASFCGGKRVLDLCCNTGGFVLLKFDRTFESAISRKARHNTCRKISLADAPSAARLAAASGIAMPTMNVNAGWIKSQNVQPSHAA